MTNMEIMENAPEATTPAKYNRMSLSELLQSGAIKKRFEDVLGQKAAGFISSIMSAVSSNKKLSEANPLSVVSAAAIAASLDLPINPNLGFAHIVPYSGNAQFQMGWRGYVQLAMRTGQYRLVNVEKVYEGELAKYDRFTGEMIFDESKKTSNNISGYVAFFRLLNGFEKYFYMTVKEIQDHGKKYSKSYSHSDGRWKLDFGAMAKKTVLKLLLNRFGILSISMEKAIQADQAIVTENDEFVYADSTTEEMNQPASSGVEAAKAALKKGKEQNENPPPAMEEQTTKEFTKEQWDGIVAYGAKKSLNDKETQTLFKWVAEQNNLPPRSIEAYELMNTQDKFDSQLDKYLALTE